MFHVTFEVLLTLISILSILRRPDKGICASSDSISIWVMRWWISGAFDSSLCLLSILNHGVHDPRWCTKKNVQYSFCHCDIVMFNVECDGALMIGKLSTPLFPLAAASMAREMLEVLISRSRVSVPYRRQCGNSQFLLVEETTSAIVGLPERSNQQRRAI
jgi:hypothetical protein